jgi:hypothetical protein
MAGDEMAGDEIGAEGEEGVPAAESTDEDGNPIPGIVDVDENGNITSTPPEPKKVFTPQARK